MRQDDRPQGLPQGPPPGDGAAAAFIPGAPGVPGRRLRRGPPPPRRKLSQIHDAIAADEARERVSVADLVRAMEGRALGALLLIFALPNALPAIPGTSGILGLPLLYLAAQMMLGRPPWLPKVVSGRSMPRADFAALVGRVNPWLEWADRFTAPRLQLLVDPRVVQVVGGFCLILSMVLVLPIPLGNMLPAIAICLIALGVLERDGLWIGGGIVVGVGSLFVASSVIALMATAVWLFIANAF